ncbi:MAG: replication initiation factor domain-containing protein [Bacilli bacterium]|nr:replication initiation factor domain-containing protein [Bacilli bacterium]
MEDKKFDAGVSNTPAHAPLKIFTTIDYLKFRFDLDNNESIAKLNPIYKILGVKIEDAQKKPGMNGYENTLKLAPGISLWYGGNATKNYLGQETCVLELKGEGCREFEIRYSVLHYSFEDQVEEAEKIRCAWVALIEECLHLDGKCTRFDIPTDDMEGIIKIDELKEKLTKGEYTTKMKHIEETSSYEDKSNMADPIANRDYMLQDVVQVNDSKNKGYSFTIGTRNHVQLCIYDKKAEQNNKGDHLDVKSWIRYEVRFYHDNAENNILLLLIALEDNKMSSFIIGCLKSIFELKESVPKDARHKYRGKTWDKWNKLVSEGEKVNLFSSSKNMSSVEISARWLILSAAKSLTKVVVVLGPEISFAEILTAFICKSLIKFNKGDLMEVNAYLRSKGKREFESVADVIRSFYIRPDFSSEFSPATVDLLLNKKSKSELKKDGLI